MEDKNRTTVFSCNEPVKEPFKHLSNKISNLTKTIEFIEHLIPCSLEKQGHARGLRAANLIGCDDDYKMPEYFVQVLLTGRVLKVPKGDLCSTMLKYVIQLK